MNDSNLMPENDVSMHFGECRDVVDGSGRAHSVFARKVVWEMLDYLVEGWRFPICELLDELLESYGEDDLDANFQYAVLLALTAQLWVRSCAANDNLFIHPKLAVIPSTHAVWKAHKNTAVQRKWDFPKIKSRTKSYKFC